MLLIILLFTACSIQTTSGSKLDIPIDFTVELREGFTGEAVTVLSNNEQIYSESPATRDVGWSYFADRFNFKMSTSKTKLKFMIPDKRLEQICDLDVSKGTLLVVSTKNNKLMFSQPNFFVDLQSGFHDNSVQVLINGQEVYNKKISDNAIAGPAGSTDIELKAAKVSLIVRVLDLGIQKEFNIDISKGTNIGIQLNKNQLLITQQKNNFLYM